MDEVLDLTDDTKSVVDAILSIEADGGGDDPEDVLDGLQRSLKMAWRRGVVKLVVLMGDAPAKDPDHEGKTKRTIADLAEAVDPAHIYALALGGVAGSAPAWDDFSALAGMTGGRTFAVEDATDLTAAIERTVAQAAAEHAKEATATFAGGGAPPTTAPWETPALAALIMANLVLAGACLLVWRQRKRTRRIGEVGWTVQIREPGAAARLFRCRAGVVRMGRALANDIVLRDPKVSGVHAELRQNPAGWVIADLNSLRGTFVGGRRIRARPALPGVWIRMGDTVVVLVTPPRGTGRGAPTRLQ
jgi:hypothetical protein